MSLGRLDGDTWTWPATWAFPTGKDVFGPVFRPGTHNAPLFPDGEGSLPWLEKENVCD